jgi:hypothetical protein
MPPIVNKTRIMVRANGKWKLRYELANVNIKPAETAKTSDCKWYLSTEVLGWGDEVVKAF